MKTSIHFIKDLPAPMVKFKYLCGHFGQCQNFEIVMDKEALQAMAFKKSRRICDFCASKLIGYRLFLANRHKKANA